MYYLLLGGSKVRFDVLSAVCIAGEMQCKALYLLAFPKTRLHIQDYIFNTLSEGRNKNQPGAGMTYSSGLLLCKNVELELKLSSAVAVYYQQKEEMPWLHALQNISPSGSITSSL